MTKYLNELQYDLTFTRSSNFIFQKKTIISWKWKVLHTLGIHNLFNEKNVLEIFFLF